MQVVLGSPADLQKLAVALAAGLGHFYLPLAAEVLARQGGLAAFNLLGRAGENHLAPVDPGPRADVHQEVRLPHGVLVVLHHNDGVAQIPQVFQGV